VRKRRPYRELPDIELDLEVDRMVRAMTEIAEHDIDRARAEGQGGGQGLAPAEAVPDERTARN
jgi:hypothetical protein